MPSPRTDLAAVATPDGRIFAIGGAVYAAGRYSPTVTVQIYDIATDTWSSGPPLPSPRSELGATLGADGRIYAFGGYDSGARREAFSLDPNDLAAGWSELPPMPSPHELTSAVTGPDGTMYVIGGWDGLRDLRRVDTYNPTVEGWRCTVPMSQGRSWAPAIASTWGMAAFGGANGSTLLGSHEFLRWSSIPVDHEPPVTTTPPTGHVPPGQVPLTNVPFVVSWADSDALTDIRDQTMLVTTDAGAYVHTGGDALADHQVPALHPVPRVPAAAVPDDSARLPRQHRPGGGWPGILNTRRAGDRCPVRRRLADGQLGDRAGRPHALLQQPQGDRDVQLHRS